MSIYVRVYEKILHAVNAIHQNLDFSKVVVEPAKDPTHGHMATNVAMVLSKSVGMAPKVFAANLVDVLKKETDLFFNVEIAGPGFINLTLTDAVWLDELRVILNQKTAYGSSDAGQNKRVNVEFVSANPTGPLHTGHGRNAVLGDVIASLLSKVGYDVVREYYINDAGGQVQTLAESVYLRYLEAGGQQVDQSDYEGKYPGDYLIPVGKKLFDTYGDIYFGKDKSEWGDLFRDFSIQEMLIEIKKDLESLGVKMDIFTSEKELTKAGCVDEVLDILTTSEDVYQGVLTPPKGHTVDDWEERPQTLFKATKYGDDIDRALKKSDGSWTYFAGDLAYHLHKIRRSYDMMLNIFGADHIGYIKRLKAAVFALSKGAITFDIKASQMVNFLDNGVPVRMSKRAGTFITLQDVVDRVGKDATRFMMVSRHQDVSIDFDFAKVVEQSKDNPIFYIQYAHARIHSVLRHGKKFAVQLDQADLTLLTDPQEQFLIQFLAQWPRQISIAAAALEPHRICTYLYELAGHFHALWNAGKDNVHLRFIDESNETLTQSRLALISGIALILQSGLELLGIQALEEMR
ncbi:MAG: Arginine--tRNA ligase [Holosporales bacterium]